ncbi:MAG: hypothetical protein OTI36_20180 [Beijerinckiaceae bacterium]|nr:hypothetical protein [Beijerinckiaceae bacterium]
MASPQQLTPKKRKERLDSAVAAAAVLSPASKQTLIARVTALAPPAAAGAAASANAGSGWVSIKLYDTFASVKADAKTVGAIDGGLWTSIKTDSDDGCKTHSYHCRVCVDFVVGNKRCGCTRALSVKEDDGTRKCEVFVRGAHLVVKDGMTLVPQSSRGLPAALIMAAGGFMNLRPAVIVDKLEVAYTDSATAQGRVLKKFLPSAAPLGPPRAEAMATMCEKFSNIKKARKSRESTGASGAASAGSFAAGGRAQITSVPLLMLAVEQYRFVATGPRASANLPDDTPILIDTLRHTTHEGTRDAVTLVFTTRALAKNRHALINGHVDETDVNKTTLAVALDGTFNLTNGNYVALALSGLTKAVGRANAGQVETVTTVRPMALAIVPSESIESVARGLLSLNSVPLRVLSVAGNSASDRKTNNVTLEPVCLSIDASPAMVGGCKVAMPASKIAQCWPHVAAAAHKHRLVNPENRAKINEYMQNLHNCHAKSQFDLYAFCFVKELKRIKETEYATWFSEVYLKEDYNTFNIGTIPGHTGLIPNSSSLERSHGVGKQAMSGGLKQTFDDFFLGKSSGLQSWLRTAGLRYGDDGNQCTADALELPMLHSVTKAGDFVATTQLVKLNTYDISGGTSLAVVPPRPAPPPRPVPLHLGQLRPYPPRPAPPLLPAPLSPPLPPPARPPPATDANGRMVFKSVPKKWDSTIEFYQRDATDYLASIDRDFADGAGSYLSNR